ncbi:MAG: PKD domain-containing protein, partial [Thermoanaerobaculia bacterium]|nr:PKD domain-containing protein [Thermoanaerobaculia bacterium]
WPRSRPRLPAIAVVVAVLLFPVCGGAVYAVARSKAIRLLGQSAITASAGCDPGSGRGEARITFSGPVAPPVLLFRDDQLVGELTLETRQDEQYKYGFLDRGLSPGTHVTYRVAKQLWLTRERLYTARVGTTVPACRAGNAAPTSEGLAIRPTRSVAGTPVVVEATGVSDPDGDTLTVLWNFGDGVVRSGRARDAHIFENPGQFVVTATLSDPVGGTVSVSDSVEILPRPAGRAPTASQTPLYDAGSVTPLEGRVGSTFLVTARPPREATERCHAPLAYRFTFENQLTRTSWDSAWVTSPTLPVHLDEKGTVAVFYALRCGQRRIGQYALRSLVRVY